MSSEGDQVRDALSAAMAEAVARALPDGELVTKWCGMVETVDADGLRGIWTLYSDGMKSWDLLGLLHFGIQREQAEITNKELGSR